MTFVWLGNMAFSHWSPNSPGNQIIKVKEEVHTLKDDVNKVREVVVEAKSVRAEMHNLIKNVEDYIKF